MGCQEAPVEDPVPSWPLTHRYAPENNSSYLVGQLLLGWAAGAGSPAPDLMCHDFVDPDARNEWIALSDLFRIIKAFGFDDRVARDGFHPHR